MKLANEFAQRQAKLSDLDWAVHAAFKLGGVDASFSNKRGVLCEIWKWGDDDVTQTMMRLERAGLVDTTIDDEMLRIITKKVFAAQQRNLRAQKGKP